MPILAGDVKLVASAVMDDVPEGGGAPTAHVIQDGTSNAIFPDISELDRAGGRLNARKLHVSVQTDDTDTYLGSNVIVAEPPADPRVSITMFSTRSTFDTRTDAINLVESYLIRGPFWNGYLFENHIAGQRVIQLFQRPGVPLPTVGRTLVLVYNEDLPSEVVQYVRIIRVESVVNTYLSPSGIEFTGRVVTCDLSDALRTSFLGSPATVNFVADAGRTKVRDTTVADSGSYYGVVPIKIAAELGDLSATCESVYTQLVPSAATESIALEVTPAQDRTITLATAPRLIQVGVVPNTLRVKIGQENRGFNYVQILTPLPAPGTTSVSFLALGNWYTLSDENGDGTLTGDAIGTVNYSSGTVSVTLPVLPDASSSVVYSWGGKSSFDNHSGQATYRAPEFSLDLEKRGIDPGSITITWLSGAVLRTATANAAGVISGDATGSVAYTSGLLTIRPKHMLDAGGEFSIDYTWSPVVIETKTGLAASSGGLTTFTLEQEPVPGSISVAWFTTQTVSSTAGSKLLSSSSTKTGGTSGGTVATQTLDSKQTSTPGYNRLTSYTTYSGGSAGSGGGGYASSTPPPPAATYEWVPERNEVTTTPRITTSNVTTDTTGGTASTLSKVSNQTSTTVVEVYNTITENGAGGFLNGLGTINYGSKSVTLRVVDPSATATSYENDTESAGDFVSTSNNTSSDPGQAGSWGTNFIPASGGSINSTTGGSQSSKGGSFGSMSVSEVFDGTSLAVTYRTGTNVETPHTESYAPGVVQIDLAPYTTNRVVPGSIRFTWMGVVYQDFDGKLYRDPVGSTPGTLAGVMDYTTGIAHITNYTVSGSPTNFTLNSLWTAKGAWTTSKICFRTPSAPIKPSGLVLSVLSVAGEQFIATANAQGKVLGPHTLGTIDYLTGVVECIFGDLVLNSALTDDQKLEWWYPEALAQITAEGYVWKPLPVDPNSLRYNVVSYFYLPLDATILGVDPVRLPQDGRVPIFRPGGFAVIGNTQKVTATVANAQVINAGRVRLSRVRVIGDNGLVINAGYTADLEAGEVTFTDVTGYSQPVTVENRIEDMVQISDVQINGKLSFTRQITHDYPLLDSYVSSALVSADLKARVSHLFDQTTWNGGWVDSVQGSSATGTYNAVLSPVVVTNKGAVTERWALVFTNTSSFNIIGEHVGVIGTGSINTDTEPLNPATGVPYFRMASAGWGSGWSVGNVVRINTIGAMFPVWVVRTVQQGPNTGVEHSFTLLSRGDVDRP